MRLSAFFPDNPSAIFVRSGADQKAVPPQISEIIVDTSQTQTQLFRHLRAGDGGVFADENDDGISCGKLGGIGGIDGSMEGELKAVLEAILWHREAFFFAETHHRLNAASPFFNFAGSGEGACDQRVKGAGIMAPCEIAHRPIFREFARVVKRDLVLKNLDLNRIAGRIISVNDGVEDCLSQHGTRDGVLLNTLESIVGDSGPHVLGVDGVLEPIDLLKERASKFILIIDV